MKRARSVDNIVSFFIELGVKIFMKKLENTLKDMFEKKKIWL